VTQFNGFWQQWFPSYLVVEHFRPDLINALFEAQKARTLQPGVNSRMLFIFDDMASNTAMRYSEELTKIAYNGRHYNTDVLYLTQDVVKATTAMRRNADNFVMLTTTGQPSLDHVYKEYASIDFADFANFQQCMLNYTEEWGAMVVDNTDSNLRGKERFKWYRARPVEELPKFIMFAPAAWGAADRSHQVRLADEQRAQFARTKKYSRNYARQLKNGWVTRLASDQIQGQTSHHERNRPESTASIFNHLVARSGAGD